MVTLFFIFVSAASILFFIAIKAVHCNDKIKVMLTVAFVFAVLSSYSLGFEHALFQQR